MNRKYPSKLFYCGILTTFLFRNIYLSVPGFLLSLIGLWKKSFLGIGLAILAIDLILSVMEQIRIQDAALTPSDNPEFNELMEALTGPGGLDAFGKLMDEKIKSAQPIELPEEEH